mgnify:CR=1 FL=1
METMFFTLCCFEQTADCVTRYIFIVDAGKSLLHQSVVPSATHCHHNGVTQQSAITHCHSCTNSILKHFKDDGDDDGDNVFLISQ